MITIELFRKSLGKLGDKLTNQEIKCLFELQSKLADAFFDSWVKNTKRAETQSKILIQKENGNCIFCYSYAYVYTFN